MCSRLPDGAQAGLRPLPRFPSWEVRAGTRACRTRKPNFFPFFRSAGLTPQHLNSHPNLPEPAFPPHPQPSPFLPLTGWGQGLPGPQPQPQQKQQVQPPGPPLHGGSGCGCSQMRKPGTSCLLGRSLARLPTQDSQSPGLRRGHRRGCVPTPHTARLPLLQACHSTQLAEATHAPSFVLFLLCCFSAAAGASSQALPSQSRWGRGNGTKLGHISVTQVPVAWMALRPPPQWVIFSFSISNRMAQGSVPGVVRNSRTPAIYL